MKKILILGSMDDFEKLTQTCIEAGYYTIVCDANLEGPAKKIAHKSYDIDVFDTKAVADMCRKEHVQGVVTGFSDVIMEAYVKLCKEVQLKCYMTEEILGIIRNKVAMKKQLSRVEVATASYEIIKSPEDIKIDEVKYPAIIKPVDGYGSNGIYKVKNKKELMTKYDEVIQYTNMKEVLAETFYDCKEYNCLAWVIKDKVYILYLCRREKYKFSDVNIALPYRFIYPMKIYTELLPKMQETVKKIARAYQLHNGPLAMQFFYDGKTVTIVEATTRLLGSGDHRAVYYATGFKAEKLLIDYAMDDQFAYVKDEEILQAHNPDFSPVIVQTQLYVKEGYIHKIEGIETIRQMPSVCQIELYFKEGDLVKKGKSELVTLGMLFFKADTYEEIDEATSRILDALKVEDQDGKSLLYKISKEETI